MQVNNSANYEHKNHRFLSHSTKASLANDIKQNSEILPLHHSVELEQSNNNNNDTFRVIPVTTTTTAQYYLSLVRRWILIVANILAWYMTNGANGIAMQTFAKFQHANNDPPPPSQSSTSKTTTTHILITTMIVTTLQLLFGALIGKVLLYGYGWYNANNRSNHLNLTFSFNQWRLLFLLPTFLLSKDKKEVSSSRKLEESQQQQRQQQIHLSEVWLSSLHALGSLFTNIGFMYGSASLVQIIKLLEPFETLWLTKLLMQSTEEGQHVMTAGVLSSMTLTIGAAISLIQTTTTTHTSSQTAVASEAIQADAVLLQSLGLASKQSTPSHQAAIMFALLSGLTLSYRNVLQRRQHHVAGKAASKSSTSCATTTSASLSKNKLERALVQFTVLSFQAGGLLLVSLIFMATLSLFFLAWSSRQSPTVLSLLLSSWFDVNRFWDKLNWRVLTWHPLYNAFSMITLSFVNSALTHSLLNAGKRVFAILMAMLWFREGVSGRTMTGLGLVTLGGGWYSMEMKPTTATSTDAARSATMNWIKPMVTCFLLGTFYLAFLELPELPSWL